MFKYLCYTVVGDCSDNNHVPRYNIVAVFIVLVDFPTIKYSTVANLFYWRIVACV